MLHARRLPLRMHPVGQNVHSHVEFKANAIACNLQEGLTLRLGLLCGGAAMILFKSLLERPTFWKAMLRKLDSQHAGTCIRLQSVNWSWHAHRLGYMATLCQRDHAKMFKRASVGTHAVSCERNQF